MQATSCGTASVHNEQAWRLRTATCSAVQCCPDRPRRHPAPGRCSKDGVGCRRLAQGSVAVPQRLVQQSASLPPRRHQFGNRVVFAGRGASTREDRRGTGAPSHGGRHSLSNCGQRVYCCKPAQEEVPCRAYHADALDHLPSALSHNGRCSSKRLSANGTAERWRTAIHKRASSLGMTVSAWASSIKRPTTSLSGRWSRSGANVRLRNCTSRLCRWGFDNRGVPIPASHVPCGGPVQRAAA